MKKIGLILVVVLTSLTMAGYLAFATPADDGGVAYGFYSDDGSYSDSSGATQSQETFAYASKQVQSYSINSSYPEYYNTNNALSNTCANVAGANIVGFYDRYYDELLPDCTAGVQRTSGYTYYPMIVNKTQKQAVIDWLYTSMATNTVEAGTSQEDFEEGLADYVTSRARNIAYSSVMTGSIFDSTKYDSEFRDGHPVVLFLANYNITTVLDYGSSVTLYKNIYTGNHIMVAFGYQTVTYFAADGSVVRQYTYMIVATGKNGETGHYLVGENGAIIDAESVIIS